MEAGNIVVLGLSGVVVVTLLFYFYSKGGARND